MKDEAEKALRQLREAAADLGPEAFDATLLAVQLNAISYTVLYIISLIICVVGGVLAARWHEGWTRRDVTSKPLVYVFLIIAFVVSLVFFAESAWIGLVSPEAALADLVLDKV